MNRSRVLLPVILASILVLTACSPSSTEETTSEPATSTPAVSYPWKVVYADDDPKTFMLPGNLVVGLDFGREISRDEQTEFKGKAKIIDGNGKGYECIASMTAGSITTTREGKTYEFGPSIFFAFDAESNAPDYSFELEDWPPFDLGDPFSEPIYSP